MFVWLASGIHESLISYSCLSLQCAVPQFAFALVCLVALRRLVALWELCSMRNYHQPHTGLPPPSVSVVASVFSAWVKGKAKAKARAGAWERAEPRVTLMTRRLVIILFDSRVSICRTIQADFGFRAF